MRNGPARVLAVATSLGLAGIVVAPFTSDAATTPAPTATPTLVYTLKSKAPSRWTASDDGSTVAVATAIRKRGSSRETPVVDVVDLRTNTTRTLTIKAPQYQPIDVSLSGDGRYLSWTTADYFDGPKGSFVVDPTTWVRDLASGGTSRYPHFDGSLSGGDGTTLIGIRGPMKRWDVLVNGVYGDEVNRGVGVLKLATGEFVPAPGRDSRRTEHLPLDVTPDGSTFAFQFKGRCFAMNTVTRATTSLGACEEYDEARLTRDGRTAFTSARGWVDTTTGQLAGPAFDVTPFAGKARSWISGVAGLGLDHVIVQCTPSVTRIGGKQQLATPRRTYLLDRATRSYAPLAAPTAPLDTSGDFTSPYTVSTADGDELFWGDGTKIWRSNTVPAGPAGPLPADCQPIR